jgi:tRNA nucleotidyltransferase (CCA-adding enzyme)
MNETDPKNSSKEIEAKVLEVIQVQWEQHERVREILSILKEKIQMDLGSLGYIGRVETQGSFVRKTYLSEDETFDLLLILQRADKPKVHQILDALEKRLKKDRIKKDPISITKHTGKIPYLRIVAGDELVNLYVGFEITPGEDNISIFDLLPMHSQYLITHMKEEDRNEVLLLKKFLKTIGVYRDEVGAIGFNGYLCELLILFYGTFQKTIEAIGKWRARTIIDLKKNIEKSEDVDLLTSEMLLKYYPLYVPDPLNPKDNVAADVSIDQFTSLIAAANTYRFNPKISFFEDMLCEIPTYSDLMRKIVHSGRQLVVLATKRNFQESEICWQKAMAMRNAFQGELFNNNYILERSKTFVSDEYYGLFLSLMDVNPQISIRKEGPLITSDESIKFLQQYTKHVDVVSGPFIDNDRWVIHFTKKGQSVFEFLESLVKKNTFMLNVDSFLKIEIKEKLKVFGADEQLREIYETDGSFAEYMFLFIERKPLWICNLKENEQM